MKRTAAGSSKATTGTIALAIGIFSLVGCGKKDIDKVSEAQSCLDSATSTTAMACLTKLEGLDTASANIVRCSVYFVDQGFSDPTRLQQVVTQITDTSNPDSASLSALTTMGFAASKYTMTENDNLSAAAQTACVASGAGGLIYLSALSRIATASLLDMGYNPGSGVAPTPAQMQTQLCTTGPSNTTKTAMGNAAVAAYNKNCVGKDISKDVMCQQYAAAMNGTTDPATIGGNLTTAICSP